MLHTVMAVPSTESSSPIVDRLDGEPLRLELAIRDTGPSGQVISAICQVYHGP